MDMCIYIYIYIYIYTTSDTSTRDGRTNPRVHQPEAGSFTSQDFVAFFCAVWANLRNSPQNFHKCLLLTSKHD